MTVRMSVLYRIPRASALGSQPLRLQMKDPKKATSDKRMHIIEVYSRAETPCGLEAWQAKRLGP